ncbi:hypothetical protein [Pseudarthrobacter polychromogenes]|uniref:Uncharacterized protein n=1 Tax=Pseudarthrobacter polychromogenes TaxID=1676 RepID=A0ABQ1Y3B0_9MICC|nr:hypothetical protein [Pseudarthrobacter polychromogenes]GGH10221.1 hypothetical protein GCM10011577_38920 [Pseudarthrobacter polychromogenes]
MSKQCPTCNRPTRKKGQTAEDFPGTVVEYKADGTCPRCDMVAKGWKPKTLSDPRPKAPSTAEAVALRIRLGREARGIPEDGTTKLRIANTRGRTRRVPQLI